MFNLCTLTHIMRSTLCGNYFNYVEGEYIEEKPMIDRSTLYGYYFTAILVNSPKQDRLIVVDDPFSIRLSISYQDDITTGSFSKNARLSDLQQTIAAFTTIPPEFQRLVLRGKIIDKDRIIPEVGFHEDDPLLSSLGLLSKVKSKKNRVMLSVKAVKDDKLSSSKKKFIKSYS